MSQAELDREVAIKTGESVQTIAQHGFTLLTPTPYELEPEPPPLTVDWDDLQQQRYEPSCH